MVDVVEDVIVLVLIQAMLWLMTQYCEVRVSLLVLVCALGHTDQHRKNHRQEPSTLPRSVTLGYVSKKLFCFTY